MIGPIKVNKARCLHCRDVVISHGDYEECSCGRLRMGCGAAMLDRGGLKEGVDYKELSEYNEEFFEKANPNTTIPKNLPRS